MGRTVVKARRQAEATAPASEPRFLTLAEIRLDGGTQPRVAINEDVVADYAAAVHELPPVVVFFDGVAYWLADGFHRVHAHRRAGEHTIEALVHQGTKRDAVLYAVGANQTHGLRRTNADKRRAVETLLGDDDWRAWPDSQIAKACGVSREFVVRVKSDLTCDRSQVSIPRPPHVPPSVAAKADAILAAGGEPRFYVTKHGTVATMDTSRIGKTVPDEATPATTPTTGLRGHCAVCGASAEVLEGGFYFCGGHEFDDLVDMPQHLTDESHEDDGVATSSLDAPGEEQAAPRLAVHFSSESPEHYTPTKVIDRVLDVFGEIDLDPCSNAHGDDANVPAATHFTRDDDGLAREWRGRVYMNPPYGREIDAWIEKLVAEHTAGRVTEAIALLPGRIDTQWFDRLRGFLWCVIKGRLTFVGNDDPAPFPSVVFYLGERQAEFYDAFADIGVMHQFIPREWIAS